ncbi:isochorismate synthase MenF [Thalassobacillus sp. CUG 92003]|uniref:isochorismate synthase n=1 Tax=Thalassobacillus sp. CUG 92003 TaxID=2736641 RepID=UPI0015E78217|nr:isochorismate synthase [Thalassobacillus sp. CUG 92003]
MLRTKTSRLEELLDEALNNATATNQPKLISFVEKINTFNPYAVIDHAADIGDRVFWHSADEDFVLVGAGSARKIMATQNNRYTDIETQWNQLKEEAIIYDPYQEKGTGIVAMGGFSFYKDNQPSDLWDAFHASQMNIPAYLFTKKGDDYYFTTSVLVFPEDDTAELMNELKRQKTQLLGKGNAEWAPPERTHLHEVDPEGWKESVKQAADDINRSTLEKVVLAREVRVHFKAPVQLASVLKDLAHTQNNSYIFAIESQEDYFVGATPERLVKVEQQRLVSTCLASTAPRGETEEEDGRIGRELLQDPKNRNEHEYVVQMIRGAVEACCENITIPEEPVLYPLENLQHLYTPVTATLQPGHTLLDVVERLHPTPAVGGLPRNKALDYIQQHEVMERGWYAGPIGWFDSDHNGEFAVAIRSALVQKDEASLFAGCGVLGESEPEAEYEETAIKLTPMLTVLGGV